MRVAPPLKSFPQNLHLTYGQVSYSLPVIVTHFQTGPMRAGSCLAGLRDLTLDCADGLEERPVPPTDSGSRPSTTSTPGCGSVVTGALGSRPRSYSLPVWLLIVCIVPAGIAWRDIAGCRRAGALTTAFGATRATPQCIHLYSAVEALTDQSEYTY